jgi:hypothetical protein
MDEALPGTHTKMTPLHHTNSKISRPPATSLLDLPNELLIDILSQSPSTPRQQRHNLVQLTSVCRRLRPLAMEELLLRPAVHRLDIWALVRTYLKYPHLALRVRNLELLNHPLYKRHSLPDALTSESAQGSKSAFKKACVAVVAQTDLFLKRKRRCIADQQHTYRNGFLAILLMMLPGTTTLYLGTEHIRSCDFLQHIFLNEDGSLPTRSRLGSVPPPARGYVDDTFAIMASKLQTLELPSRWQHYFPIPTLLMFTSLKHLSIPADALPRYMVGLTNTRFSNSRKKQPLHAFPPTLEALVVHACERPPRWFSELILFFATSKTVYPVLQTMTVIYDSICLGIACATYFSKCTSLGRAAGTAFYVRCQSVRRLREALGNPGTELNLDFSTITDVSDAEIKMYESRGVPRV